MNIKKYVTTGLTLAVLGGLAVALPAFADTATLLTGSVSVSYPGGGMRGGPKMMKSGIFGTVSAMSGNTITLTSKKYTKSTTAGTAPTSTNVTYTVDATNATVMKNGTTSTTSAILVGDTLSVQGTVSGTTVTATTIRDSVLGNGKGMMNGRGKLASSTPPIIQGNGQPVVAGTISAISGNTLTITNKSNVTYSIDITNSKIAQGQSIISASGLTIGDSILVQGTVNGNSVVAYSVTDQKAPANTTGGTASSTHKGFFGGLGNFFAHLFGF